MIGGRVPGSSAWPSPSPSCERIADCCAPTQSPICSVTPVRRPRPLPRGDRVYCSRRRCCSTRRRNSAEVREQLDRQRSWEFFAQCSWPHFVSPIENRQLQIVVSCTCTPARGHARERRFSRGVTVSSKSTQTAVGRHLTGGNKGVTIVVTRATKFAAILRA